MYIYIIFTVLGARVESRAFLEWTGVESRAFLEGTGVENRAFLEGTGARAVKKNYRVPEPVKNQKNGSQ